MNQLVQFDPAHDELIADMEFDFSGTKLCTVGSDHTIKVWQSRPETGQWKLLSSWSGHDSSLTKVCWAHPEFGNLIATGSFDRTVRIWQQTSNQNSAAGAGLDTVYPNADGQVEELAAEGGINRWHHIATKKDAQGMIVDLAFAPHYMGLQLAAASSDGFVRIYETGSPVRFDNWTLASEIDVNGIAVYAPYLEHRTDSADEAETTTPAVHTTAATATTTSLGAQTEAATPAGTDSSVTGGASHAGNGEDSLVDAAEKSLLVQSNTLQEAGNNVCIAWCPTRFLPNTLAVGCGREKDAKIYRYINNRWVVYAVLPDHTDIVHTISWAPQVGRSYHLLATGSRDHYVRIFKVEASYGHIALTETKDLVEEYTANASNLHIKASLIAAFSDHNAEVWSVSWNVTGTILSSSGDDGKVRLWKASSTGEWSEIQTIATEQGTE
ncbi:epoxide hydrolase, soluble (sEH) [Tieghemiomyces parasiticus]|uniref:Epoxide hydrolase, soluble (SEH) n=1 Tax=Tieghemiomyces parasiticus TaxID=78921 RepID=A0A9W8A861_9FUNG|nr:epoxide hydrolase, soluble (sEH) [Tieghemiomyces parasiticus]